MSYQAVVEYLIAIQGQYQASSRAEKSALLDHAQLVTGRSRKQLIRRLALGQEKLSQKPKSGRPNRFDKEALKPHIYYLWEQMERVSAKRMKAAFKDWLRFYDDCPAHLKMQLQSMSATTLERYLSEARKAWAPKGLSTTSPARYMKNKIPIGTLDREIKEPGNLQADTVAHCGTRVMGPFISSLTVTDIWSAWTENHALFTKKQYEVHDGFKAIEKRLPFSIKAINTDSGTEFLNSTMWRYTGYGSRIKFTRSRPYKKNDNCYVEQKNFTHVRELFGYERFEDPELVELMNEIYQDYWSPLQNFFLPTFKLKEKVRVGAKIKKKYETPKTPYQRLMESNALTNVQKQELQTTKLSLNPFILQHGLERKLKEFFDIVRRKTIREVS